jgi:hypothetical protein
MFIDRIQVPSFALRPGQTTANKNKFPSRRKMLYLGDVYRDDTNFCPLCNPIQSSVIITENVNPGDPLGPCASSLISLTAICIYLYLVHGISMTSGKKQFDA